MQRWVQERRPLLIAFAEKKELKKVRVQRFLSSMNTEEMMDILFIISIYIDSGAYVFIEWPEKAEAFILPPYVQLTIEFEGTQRRIEYDSGFRIPDS